MNYKLKKLKCMTVMLNANILNTSTDISKMQRLNRNTLNNTIAELIGDDAENTLTFFQPDREKNEGTVAKLRIPEHQRFYVWTASHKEALIDSVMKNCPVPLMVFTQHVVNGEIVWFIQDGQQRLMTLQKFILGQFTWNNKHFAQLSERERSFFLNFKINYELIYNPTADQVADIFERLNSGKPLTDNDKFFNRRQSPVIAFILEELIVNPRVSDNFKKLTGLNVSSKTRVQLGDIVGAVVAIINNSVFCIRTSFDRIGQEIHQEMTEVKKEQVYSAFETYFSLVNQALADKHIAKPKKVYLKLTGMLGIWLYWLLHEDHFVAISDDDEALTRANDIWIWFAQEIQDSDRKSQIFANLSGGHQRNLDVEALRARTAHLMNLQRDEDTQDAVSSLEADEEEEDD